MNQQDLTDLFRIQRSVKSDFSPFTLIIEYLLANKTVWLYIFSSSHADYSLNVITDF